MIDPVAMVFGIMTALIMIPVEAAFLMLVARWFKLNESGYLLPLKIAAIVGVLEAVIYVASNSPSEAVTGAIILVVGLAVSIALGLYLVKSWYEIRDAKTAVLAWLVWFVMANVASFIVRYGLLFAIFYIGMGVSG